ncbi:hypothetical protein P7C70_g8158, partial [Phenoliferia sp. Uapishka_3]
MLLTTLISSFIVTSVFSTVIGAPFPPSNSKFALKARKWGPYDLDSIIINIDATVPLYHHAQAHISEGKAKSSDVDKITALVYANVLGLNVRAKLDDVDARNVTAHLDIWTGAHHDYLSSLNEFQASVTASVDVDSWHSSLYHLNTAITVYSKALLAYIPDSEYTDCDNRFTVLTYILNTSINIWVTLKLTLLGIHIDL